MPASRRSMNTSSRKEPYPSSHADAPICPIHGKPAIYVEEDKENASPNTKRQRKDSVNDSDKSTSNNKSSKKPSGPAAASKEPDRSNLPDSYLDIPLEEIKGEVPVYEDVGRIASSSRFIALTKSMQATQIRRKLNKLVASKAKIPGSDKKWSQASLADEMQTIAQNHHPIKTYNNHVGNEGPKVNSVRRFLKNTGVMGGGDSAPYYYGNMLLEKLRIWNGEKKTTAREKAEKEYVLATYQQQLPSNLLLIDILTDAHGKIRHTFICFCCLVNASRTLWLLIRVANAWLMRFVLVFQI